MPEKQHVLLELLQRSGARLHALLVRVTLREDVAEDLLQELFLRLDASAGFYEASCREAYAQTAAIRLAFDWRRSRAARPVETLVDEPVGQVHSPLDGLVEAEQIDQVLCAMERLSESDSEILVLRHLQQLRYDQIAKLRDTTAHGARAQCHKAMTRLRGLLDVSPESASQKETPRADA